MAFTVSLTRTVKKREVLPVSTRTSLPSSPAISPMLCAPRQSVGAEKSHADPLLELEDDELDEDDEDELDEDAPEDEEPVDELDDVDEELVVGTPPVPTMEPPAPPESVSRVLPLAHAAIAMETPAAHARSVVVGRTASTLRLASDGAKRTRRCTADGAPLSVRGTQIPVPPSKVSVRLCACVMRLPGGTLCVTQTLPPMLDPRPMVMRPRMVAPA
jgi:hypothetical protein